MFLLLATVWSRHFVHLVPVRNRDDMELGKALGLWGLKPSIQSQHYKVLVRHQANWQQQLTSLILALLRSSSLLENLLRVDLYLLCCRWLVGTHGNAQWFRIFRVSSTWRGRQIHEMKSDPHVWSK